MTDRSALESRWLDLTRRELTALTEVCGWPVRADHCFQRILLDAACGGVWYDSIAGRPAYAHASDAILRAAVVMGEGAIAGTVDMAELNARSLDWRRARKGSA